MKIINYECLFLKDEQKIEDVVQTADNETSEDSDASNLHPVVVKPSQVSPVCEYVVQKKTLKQKIRTVNMVRYISHGIEDTFPWILK